MGGTVRVLTIRGIPINVHVSWGAADASYSQMALREALARLPVREIMMREL